MKVKLNIFERACMSSLPLSGGSFDDQLLFEKLEEYDLTDPEMEKHSVRLDAKTGAYQIPVKTEKKLKLDVSDFEMDKELATMLYGKLKSQHDIGQFPRWGTKLYPQLKALLKIKEDK